MIFLQFKNSVAYYNAGVVAVNSKIVGLAPGFTFREIESRQGTGWKILNQSNLLIRDADLRYTFMYRLAVFELTISNFLAMQFVEMMAR
jgi:hypothetical protein